MTSLIRDFAAWFKARDTPIEKWYSDGNGKFAFRVTVAGAPLVCAARSTSANGRTSVMKRVGGKAQVLDGYVVLRIGDDVRVFDPTTVLGHGDVADPKEDDRADRGEEWVYFDVDLGCRFDDWYDGHDHPVEYHDVDAF